MESNIFIAYTGAYTKRQMWNKYSSYDEVLSFFNEVNQEEKDNTKIEMCVINGRERAEIKTISDLLELSKKFQTI